MKVRNFIEDVGGASRVTKRRQAVYDKASNTPKPFDPIGDTAKKLHPGFIDLTVTSVRQSGKDARTIRFTADHLPYFKAGQFMTLRMKIGDSIVTRPYSISSAPYETRGEAPFIEITVRRPRKDGFAADWLYDNVKEGDTFTGEAGLGEFCHEPLRDADRIMALAGGSGITPFVSMAKEIRNGKMKADLTILYGSRNEEEIILKEELEECICDHVRVIHVLSEPEEGWTGETGFLTKELIGKYTQGDTSYFICGPQVMYAYMLKQLEEMNVPKRRIRCEVFGQAADITKDTSYPSEIKDSVFDLRVEQGTASQVIPARADESIAAALERAGIVIHTRCRSGACGICRIKVLSGRYHVRTENDGRRAADKEFNYVHACAAYPLSDLTVKINIPMQ